MKISIGKSRKDIKWRVIAPTWEELCEKLSNTVRTPETLAEYKSMSRDDKSARKDIGGFVGGVISGGRRSSQNVASRSLITLDADFATPSSWDDAIAFNDYTMCCYSTHSHQPKAPRLRYVIPLSREVSPEEYEPIARLVAKDLGIEQFDVTTYEVSRLMYWPSTPSDGEFVFHKQDGYILNPDSVLERYTDWHDTLSWPIGSQEQKVRTKNAAAKQGDPTTKPGIVGVFCRTYDVPAAIEKFLPDVYIPCTEPNRYTYSGGSTTSGGVLYSDGQFLYSHHSTDPAGGQLCNAYDLVRLHKFGAMDADIDPDMPINKRPSSQAMADFVSKLDEIKQTQLGENLEAAKEIFGDTEADTDWASKLSLTKAGAVDTTIDNLLVILNNDPNFAGKLALNSFTNRLCKVDDLPWCEVKDRVNGDLWSDVDESALRYYIESTYGINNTQKLSDALNVCMLGHAFHPIRDYLNGIKWDGIPRAETLFVDYLGAEDDEYTRTVTKKWLTAAVARVMNPGCKFDNMIVLVGDQGVGKSYLASRLGKHWFSDTLLTVQGKEAYEQLKGCWIIEMSELSAMKKAEVESTKMFISKQVDTYRGAYNRHTQSSPRQCVFYGSTNDDAFLRDVTGNRRFWPIGVDKSKRRQSLFDLSEEVVDQMWAEAKHWFDNGEKLYLSEAMSKEAEVQQEKYTLEDPRLGQLEEYLDTEVPENWNELDKTARRNYIQGYSPLEPGVSTFVREEISASEIAYELYGKEIMQPWEAKDISNLLKRACWEKTGKRRRTIYGTQYIYRRKEE